MIAYKFRSMNNSTFPLDIVLNNRIYCATIESLNDPNELRPVVEHHDDQETLLKAIVEGHKTYSMRDSLRVCSLSLELKSELLWAYYADGYKGCAIALEVPDSDFQRVRYGKPFVVRTTAGGRRSSPKDLATLALHRKGRDWRHEREVRHVTDREYYVNGRVTGVYLGPRMANSVADVLKAICALRNVPVFKVSVSYSEFTVSPCLSTCVDGYRDPRVM